MSNLSGGSTGSSNGGARHRGRVIGVPKRCWCGNEIMERISKSEANPYRRYYRCAFAVARKLANDNHIFKWVDEATLDEIMLVRTAERVEMEMKIEKEVFERVEETLLEAKCTMKKMMVLVFLGCLIIVGCGKLVG